MTSAATSIHLALGLVTAVPASLLAQEAAHRSTHHDYRVVTVAAGLVNPWSIAFLPGGDMLVTEPGRAAAKLTARIIEPGPPPRLASRKEARLPLAIRQEKQ
ncbi:MAG: hypothetical protein ACR2HZ_02940 [Gemmatimonadaceae bacterium]